jgi:hypothetical protein
MKIEGKNMYEAHQLVDPWVASILFPALVVTQLCVVRLWELRIEGHVAESFPIHFKAVFLLSCGWAD